MNKNIQVQILIGSDSDYAVMIQAKEILDELGISSDITIASAHRTPEKVVNIVKDAEKIGVKVFIAGAGMAAHLAGAIAARTVLPVIGVPLDGSSMNGLDALLATVQMPFGVPVATLAIGKAGAKNSAILAAQILSLSDSELALKLKNWRDKQVKNR